MISIRKKLISIGNKQDQLEMKLDSVLRLLTDTKKIELPDVTLSKMPPKLIPAFLAVKRFVQCDAATVAQVVNKTRAAASHNLNRLTELGYLIKLPARDDTQWKNRVEFKVNPQCLKNISSG